MTKNITQKIAIIAILLITFFGMNFEESKAQAPCPSGYTLAVFNTFVDGCWYEIKICYICSPVSHILSEVALYSYRPLNPLCIQSITDEELMDSLKQKGVDYFLSTNCIPRPCNETPAFYFIINEFACWKRTAPLNEVVACSSNAICQTLFHSCVQNGIIINTEVSTNWQFNSQPNCGSIVSNIPQIVPPASETSCVRIKTKCD